MRSWRRKVPSDQNSISCGATPESGPVVRPRNLADGVAGRVGGDRLLQREARFERPRLLAGPGPDPAAALARGEIGVGLGGADLRHRPAHPHLLPEALPVEAERRLGVGEQLPPLGALEIGEEDEPRRVEALEQHHPHVGQPVAVDGGERHRVGVVGLGGLRRLKPFAEKGDRLRCSVQSHRSLTKTRNGGTILSISGAGPCRGPARACAPHIPAAPRRAPVAPLFSGRRSWRARADCGRLLGDRHRPDPDRQRGSGDGHGQRRPVRLGSRAPDDRRDRRGSLRPRLEEPEDRIERHGHRDGVRAAGRTACAAPSPPRSTTFAASAAIAARRARRETPGGASRASSPRTACCCEPGCQSRAMISRPSSRSTAE